MHVGGHWACLYGYILCMWVSVFLCIFASDHAAGNDLTPFACFCTLDHICDLVCVCMCMGKDKYKYKYKYK